MTILSLRLKAARQRAALSQERLGIEAGIDPSSASARVNRYETGSRIPDPDTVQRLAVVLNVPAAYFYAVADDEAELLLTYHGLPESERRQLIDAARTLLAASQSRTSARRP